VGEHVRVHHAAAHHLQPTGLLADPAALATALHTLDVDLGRGFGERKVRRPEAGLQVFPFEEGLQERTEHSAQIGEGDVGIHVEAFDLVEHRAVREIGIAAIHPPRRDDSQGRRLFAHGADLDRRGVRAQHTVGVEIEGVVHRPRGVLLGDVQGLEVVEIVLDLGAFSHLIAHPRKELPDTLDRLGHGVQGPRHRQAPRKTDIDATLAQLAGDLRRCERLLPRLDQA
jgi:hypothetical protein